MKSMPKEMPAAPRAAIGSRLLSAFLTLIMVLGLLPASVYADLADGLAGLTAQSAGAVKYDRETPEVAILNRYTGDDASFYKKLIGNTDGKEEDRAAYWQYNGITLFGKNYSDRAEDEDTWTGTLGSDSVLKSLTKPSKNLEISTSATFYNRTHTHSNYQWKKAKKWTATITSYESMNISFGGSYGAVISGKDDDARKYPRIGNYGDTGSVYKTLVYHDGDDSCTLHFYPSAHSWYDFEWRECTCGGTYAENILVTFRDTRAPLLTGVYYRTDGQSYTNRHKGFLVGGGDTLYIKLSFDEPIRFADDSPDHGDLYLELQADGTTTGSDRKAYLTELSGNDLIFTYKFDEKDANRSIAALDLSSLFGTDLTLVQVGKNGSFSIAPTDKSGEGFTTTTCYITDLAGNALTQQTVGSAKLTLDSETPYVKKVEFNLSLNNADVKEALGKTDTTHTDYTDNSDLYLGVGDSVTLTIQMNERLQGIAMSTIKEGTVLDWKHAVATTNIKDASGNYVTVRSQFFSPYHNFNSGDTAFLMQPITIGEDWTVEGNGGEIKVIKFEISEDESASYGKIGDSVTDKAGNELNKNSITIAGNANSNPPKLDVTAPAVEEISGSYAKENNGFRYGVTIGDDSSGYEGIYGSFILNNGGDGKAYQYQWAVKADTASTVADDEWQTGTTGVAQRFIQTQSAYIHIRPLDGETYGDLSGCTLTVKAKDYAGNESSVTLPPEDGTLDWYIDNLAPTVRAGEVSRALNGDTGTLTAEVILTDSKGISGWQYAWGDSDTQAPENGWENGSVTATDDSDPVTVTAEGTVKEGSLFSQYLWVKATDNSDNKNESAPICLGQYTYDLQGAQYELEYSNGITKTASLEVTSLEADDALFFLLKAGDADEYFLWRSYGDDANKATIEGNLFEKLWFGPYTLEFAEDTKFYTLTPTGNTASMPKTGNLSVTVLSGKAESITRDEQTDTWTLGNKTYTFNESTITLRVAGTDRDNYENISLSSSDDLGAEPSRNKYSTDDGNYRTSLEGLQFTVKIGEDKNGWNYADVDWASSYIELTNVTDSSKNYQVYLHQGQTASDGSTTQTVTVPTGNYATGIYTARLHLVCFAGKGYEADLTKDDSAALITVDTVEPNSDFALTELNYILDDQGYGIRDSIGTLDLMSDGVIKLPMAQQTTGGNAAYSYMYSFTVTSTGEPDVVQLDRSGRNYRFGQYTLQIWSSADPDNVIEIAPVGNTAETEQTTVKNMDSGNNYGFVFSKNSADEHNLYLEPDTVNNISMRKVYSNGRTSDVKTVQIQPVKDFVTGTASVDTATKELVFKPDSGVSTVGATAYAWIWQNSENPRSGKGEAIEMNLGADGTWRCPLAENGAQYAVVTVSASGCIWNADYAGETVRERAPWFYNIKSPYSDDAVGDRGSEGLEFADHGDGTYTLSFRVRDDYDTIKNGLTLDIGFNETYSKDSLRLNLKDSYTWTETGVSATGISSVTVKKYQWDFNEGETTVAYYSDYLDVTIEGSYVPNRSETDITDSQTMQITVTAADALGNSTSISTGEMTVAYQTPTVTGDSLCSDGLTLTFNQPVRPADSWAWHDADSDVKGFQKEWSGAFPIPGNGTYELQFTDIFGIQCTQEWPTTAFTVGEKDYSIDLDFTDPNGDGKSTVLTATSKDGYLIFRDAATSDTLWSGNGYETIRVSGGVWQGKTIEWTKESGPDYIGTAAGVQVTAKDVFTDNGVKERSVLWNTTGKILIRHGSGYSAEGNHLFSLTVYIDDVVSSAPAADVRYYVYALGQEFTQAELEQYIKDNGGSVTVIGSVRTWYTTTRHVTPTGDTGSEFTFTPNGETSHTFTYVDDLGNTGTATAALPDGLTLKAPAQPPEDNTAPTVDVDIYVKRGGVYTRAESFLGTLSQTEIEKRFENLSYVQGYSLTVNASDESGFDIEVKGDGASLTGNVVTIDTAGEITITVTDRSTKHNATTVTFTVPDRIDNTPPVIDVKSEATSLYSKNLYITVTDNSGSAVLDFPAGLDIVPSGSAATGKDVGHEGAYKYAVSDNGTVQFIARDMAGNTATASSTITGIDTDPPTLTVRWSPPYTYYDSDGKKQADDSQLTKETVNTNVTARVSSDKAMYGLTVRAGNEEESEAHTLLAAGKVPSGEPYQISGQDGPLVTFTATPEQVLVTYAGNYDQSLIFTATAPNGKSSTLILDGVSNVIDKTAPSITAAPDPLIRSGYTVPYAVKVTLTPDDESVTSPNYGETQTFDDPQTGTQLTEPVWYDPSNPLTLTFTANGTYSVRFADAAGNVTIVPVKIDGIDRTAPVLTVGTPNVSGQTATVEVTVDEACTLTWGDSGSHDFTDAGSCEINFGQNGTYAITATDAAGNESIKMVTVGSIDDKAPTISFTSSTIYVMQGSDKAALEEQLKAGYTADDNVKAEGYPKVDINSSAVKLDTAGQYTVVYTVTDAAGNKTTANRLVRVIGANTVCLNIDGKLILPDSTAVLRPGDHTMTLTNSDQPYSVKARKGILSAGQMKYLSGSSLSFDENGRFTVTGTGYYTLLVTTQDRQTIRILLYIEQ